MSKELRPEIIGLGKAFGSRVITNADIDQRLGVRSGLVDRMGRTVGLNERHWVSESESTSTLAANAAVAAIEMAKIPRDSIRAITVATSLSDYLGVPTSAQLQDKLGIPTDVAARDVTAACPGFIHALQVTYADLSSPYGLGGLS